MRPRRTRPAQTGPSYAETLVVALGGAIGAPLRWSIERTWIATDPLALKTLAPLVAPIVVINTVGAGALGVLLGMLERRAPHRLLRPFLAVGVLGAFTTFSSLALETVSLALERGLLFGVLKVTFTLALGLLAFLGGERWGRRL